MFHIVNEIFFKDFVFNHLFTMLTDVMFIKVEILNLRTNHNTTNTTTSTSNHRPKVKKKKKMMKNTINNNNKNE